MKLLSIHYDRLVNLGNYENEKLGATAEVGEGDDPAAVYAELRALVDGYIVTEDVRRDIASSVREMRREVTQLEAVLEQLRLRWDKARTFLEAHGVSAPDELPF